MSPVDPPQGLIADALDAILHQQERLPVQPLQIAQQAVGHAVRPGSDDQPHHAVHVQRLLILSPQHVESGIRVCISLKVGQILHGRIFMGEEPLAFLQLHGYGLVGVAIGGIERLVVAIRASAEAHRPVTVGAGEARMERYLLHLEREHPFQVGGKLVVERAFSGGQCFFPIHVSRCQMVSRGPRLKWRNHQCANASCSRKKAMPMSRLQVVPHVRCSSSP